MQGEASRGPAEHQAQREANAAPPDAIHRVIDLLRVLLVNVNIFRMQQITRRDARLYNERFVYSLWIPGLFFDIEKIFTRRHVCTNLK
jgi:hypothetical protein